MQAAHTVCTYAPPIKSEMLAEINWMLITLCKISLLFIPEDMESVISNKNVKFGLVWP